MTRWALPLQLLAGCVAGAIVAVIVARSTDLPCTFTLAIPPR